MLGNRKKKERNYLAPKYLVKKIIYVTTTVKEFHCLLILLNSFNMNYFILILFLKVTHGLLRNENCIYSNVVDLALCDNLSSLLK